MGEIKKKTKEEIEFEKSPSEKARDRVSAKLKEKPFNVLSRTEKDELLYELLIMHGLIEGAN